MPRTQAPKIDRAARRKAFEVALAHTSPGDPTPILTAMRATGVPRTSAYRYAEGLQRKRDAKPLKLRHVKLIARIGTICEHAHGIPGADKVHEILRREEKVGHNLVAKLMKLGGWVGTYNAPKVARKRDVAPDSVRGDWHREGRKVIAADTMQFRCRDGNLFVAGNVDCDSRRTFVATSPRNDTCLTTASLRDAARNVQLDPGVAVTALSDQGPQYTAAPYTATIERLGMERANTPVHTPTRNALMEGTWSLFRREFPRYVQRATHGKRTIRQLSWRAVKGHMRDYVRWFNHERLHSALGYRSPAEFEALPRDERRQILAAWDHERDIARAARHAEIEAHNAARAARVIASLVQCAPRLASVPLAFAA